MPPVPLGTPTSPFTDSFSVAFSTPDSREINFSLLGASRSSYISFTKCCCLNSCLSTQLLEGWDSPWESWVRGCIQLVTEHALCFPVSEPLLSLGLYESGSFLSSPSQATCSHVCFSER